MDALENLLKEHIELIKKIQHAKEHKLDKDEAEEFKNASTMAVMNMTRNILQVMQHHPLVATDIVIFSIVSIMGNYGGYLTMNGLDQEQTISIFDNLLDKIHQLVIQASKELKFPGKAS